MEVEKENNKFAMSLPFACNGMERKFPIFHLATALYDAGKEKQIDWEKHLILTDSLSTISAIQNNNKNPLIQKIIKQLHDGGGNLRLKWIP
jgi:hypothetical protein